MFHDAAFKDGSSLLWCMTINGCKACRLQIFNIILNSCSFNLVSLSVVLTIFSGFVVGTFSLVAGNVVDEFDAKAA